MAMILFKGDGKDKESHTSYRNIWTFPFILKALDKHVSAFYESWWAAAQAETSWPPSSWQKQYNILYSIQKSQFTCYF